VALVAISNFVPLPVFGADSALSAMEMNLLTMSHVFVQNSNMVVYPQWQIHEGEFRALYHKPEFQYIMWKTESTLDNARLTLNNVQLYGFFGNEGTIFLDTDGSNPYALVDNEPYDVGWRNDGVSIDGVYFIEAPTDTGTPFAYPAAIKTFQAGNVLSAQDLNDIVDNTNYLLDQHVYHVVPGFRYLEESIPQYASEIRRERYFWMQHFSRYLHVILRHNPSNEDAELRDINIRIDGFSVYGSTFQGGSGAQDYSVIIDTAGSDHLVVSGASQTVNTPPGKPYGGYYKIDVMLTGPLWGQDTVEWFLIAEMPGHSPVARGDSW